MIALLSTSKHKLTVVRPTVLHKANSKRGITTGKMTLLPHELLVLSNAEQSVIKCYGGSVWMTQEGDSTDYIVTERFEISNPGKIVVQALSKVDVCVVQTG